MKTNYSIEIITSKILEMRGKKVMIDRDLAILYNVPTKVLNQAVRRNIKRFPADFMFQLRKQETEDWRSQFVTSNYGKMGIRRMPYAFTEQGVAMLSSVLNSDRAIHVNILIMRAFVKLRELLVTQKDLAAKIEELEKKHIKHDEKIGVIFETIRQLSQPPEKPNSKIGFHP